MGFVDTGRRSGQIEHLDYGAALTTHVSAVPTADVVGNYASLLICRSCKGDEGIFISNKMLDLNSISCGVNIRNRGFHTVIDHNAASNTKFQSGFFCKMGVRRYTDGKHCYISVKRCAI